MIESSRRSALPVFLACLVVSTTAGMLLAPAAHALGATRTWVSGVGDDANPCSRTAPCKTFAGAISKTETGGEIDALDGAGFGSVTITKSITIDAVSVKGGVLSPGANGIIINNAAADVVLRGLDIAGASTGVAPACIFSGLNGIRILAARSVRIEDSTINEMSLNGIDIVPTSAATVSLDHLTISNACGSGINVAPTGGGSANVLVENTTVTGTATAVNVGDGGHLWLNTSTIFGNAVALTMTGTGIVDSSASTTLFGNGSAGTPPASIFNAPPVGPTGAAGATGATGAMGAVGPSSLAIVFATPALRAKAGRKVVVRYGLSSNASSTLLLKRGGKVVAKVAKIAGKRGTNSLGLATRLKGKALQPGTYTLTLVATRADGVDATATTTLKLLR